MKLASKSMVSIAICFLGCGASVATATQIAYNISFTNTGQGGPAAGSFTYDSQAALGNQFSNFLVTWDGYTFNFTSAANTGPSLSGTCNSTPTNSATSFLLMTTGACTPTLNFGWRGQEFGNSITSEFILFDGAAVGTEDRDLGNVASTATETRSTRDIGGGNFTTTAASPEPSTTCLGLLGGSLLAAAVRRRRRV